MLISGCWAVRLQPAVWTWKRHSQERGIFRLVFLLHGPGPDPPGRPHLGDLLEEIEVGVEEERQPGREILDVQARGQGVLDVGEAVGQGEGQLLGRPSSPASRI